MILLSSEWRKDKPHLHGTSHRGHAGTLKEEELVLKLKRNPAPKLQSSYERVFEEAKGDIKGVELICTRVFKPFWRVEEFARLKGEWFQKWVKEWVASSRDVAWAQFNIAREASLSLFRVSSCSFIKSKVIAILWEL
jgi:hypothetical protein